MKLSNISLLALWGLASAAPTKRSPASIESAISSISGNLGTLDKDINSFTGSFFEALGLLVDFNNLQSSISSATSEVTSTGALGESDSATIYSALSSLASQVAGTLSDTEAKASVVISNGYTSNVHDALTSLQSGADGFFSALEGTVSSTYSGQVSTLQSSLDAAFATAIADF